MIEKAADIQVSILTSLKKYMMEKEGVKEGEVWKRPEGEKVESGQMKVIQPPQVEESKEVKEEKEDKEEKEEKIGKEVKENTSTAQDTSAVSTSIEEVKMEGKFFDLSLDLKTKVKNCLLYTSPSPRDLSTSRMPSSA